MIDKSLEALKRAVQNYLVSLPELNLTSEDAIVLSPIVKADGSLAIPDNSLGLTLVNIEEERVVKSQNAVSIASDGRVSIVNPEIKLNLFILIAANFTNYDTGLQFLSAVVKCFQSKNVFTPDNTPLLDSSIQKLIVELFSLDFEKQNHLWGSLGAKYLPSVLYRVRLVAIQEGIKQAEQAPITIYDLKEKEK
ncbi:MAG: DUF4255 domain-containing protein [Ignavibacteriales bacterium]|nr:DUF4255 domain-containing protein [Ignavibacteriales bacterium]